MVHLRQVPPADVAAALAQYDEVARSLLYARGIETVDEGEAFFARTWVDYDPFVYAEMGKAVERTRTAIEGGERIGIWSDYDCDGIPAAAVLTCTLRAYGCEKLSYYVPRRNQDGFGLNAAGVERVVADGVQLLFVIDCGTTDAAYVATLREAGIDVVILDHHLPGGDLPEAYALINPVVENVPGVHPCAAGVVYLFIKALISHMNEQGNATLPVGWEKWQLDLVAMSTVSDMVPLRGINRQLVWYGLQVMRKSPRPGLQALCKEVRVKQETLTVEDISFSLIPRINAASRMGDERAAYELLVTDEVARAGELATQLTKLNQKRKTLVAQYVKKAMAQVATKDPSRAVWVFGDRSWKPSIVGLVAQKIASTYGKTVFVWGQSEGATPSVKGSFRSAVADAHSIATGAPELFDEVGGHRFAGGFTFTSGAEVRAEEVLNAVPVPSEEHVETAAEVVCTLDELGDVHRTVTQFEPFGTGNAEVVFEIENCDVQDVVQFGKNKEHVRYVLGGGRQRLEAVSFFVKDPACAPGNRVNVVGTVGISTFTKRMQIRVLNVTPVVGTV